MRGRLTTHVLDTTHGTPAKGLKICLFDAQNQLICDVTTNDDGRVERPLLEGDHFYKGQFKLCFHVGDYYKTTDLKLSEPAFLDIVPVAFGISDEQAHYHVPLLISPYGYSTYRGS